MKTPSIRLVLRAPISSPAQAQEFGSKLVHTTLASVMRSIRFLFEPDVFACAFSKEDAALAARQKDVHQMTIDACPWMGRIELDMLMLMRVGMKPSDVAVDLGSYFPLLVFASDESDPVWLLHVRPTGILSGGTPHATSSIEERCHLRNSCENIVLKACREMALSGLPGISSCSVGSDIIHVDGEEELIQETRAVIDTHGGTLAQVLCMPEVDAPLCVSNDVHDVFHTLGIEAAAAVLFDQIKQTLQFDGSYTNERHLLLLCSFCTSSSTLLPVSRHGINRSSETGALTRASFEEVTDQLIEAATYGDSELTSAFSPAIMVGQRALNVGTGICYALSPIKEKKDECDSDNDVIFTSIDADVEMLSYQHVSVNIEAPYSDAGTGIGLPAALHHSYVANAPTTTMTYAPSSPKTIMGMRKRRYEPSSPKTDRCGIRRV